MGFVVYGWQKFAFNMVLICKEVHLPILSTNVQKRSFRGVLENNVEKFPKIEQTFVADSSLSKVGMLGLSAVKSPTFTENISKHLYATAFTDFCHSHTLADLLIICRWIETHQSDVRLAFQMLKYEAYGSIHVKAFREKKDKI